MVIALCVNTYALAENICECPDPPGGSIRCEDDQVGFCNLEKGKIKGACITPPPTQTKGMALEAWVLSELFKKRITTQMIQEDKQLQVILKDETFIDPLTGAKTRFSLPRW